MKNIIRVLAIGIFLSCLGFAVVEDWGFYGHREINRYAVFTLPPELIGFYKKHIGYVSEHAVDPDKRRYATKYEAIRHYIDIDHWGTYPFDNVPREFPRAIAKFSDLVLITGSDTVSYAWKDRVVLDSILTWTSGMSTFSARVDEYERFFYREVMPKYYEEDWVWQADSTQFLAGVEFDQLMVVDHFSEYGILPYHLLSYYKRLVRAFEIQDRELILQLSADMGHYVGDAHVPLHTTENYNGAMSNQIGIHAFWESRIPELLAAEEYDFFVGKAEYIEDPKEYFWDIVLTSHSLVDSVLLIEKRVRASLSEDQIYCYVNRLDQVIRTQCEAFTIAYSDAMKGMVEKRMTESVQSIGSVWFSAWVDAGQPVLDADLDLSGLKAQAEALTKEFRQGDSKGRAHDQ